MKNNLCHLPAGKYYIGDLCYVLNSSWDEVCELLFAEGSEGEGKFTLANGTEFVTFSTQFGDGTYPSNQGTAIDVDSGSIGCVSVEHVESLEAAENDGMIVEFDDKFTCWEEDGILNFGHVSISTGSEDDEDYAVDEDGEEEELDFDDD